MAAETTLARMARAVLGDGADIDVEVAPHPKHGVLATLRVAGAGQEALDALGQQLDKLQLRHVIEARTAALS